MKEWEVAIEMRSESESTLLVLMWCSPAIGRLVLWQATDCWYEHWQWRLNYSDSMCVYMLCCSLDRRRLTRSRVGSWRVLAPPDRYDVVTTTADMAATFANTRSTPSHSSYGTLRRRARVCRCLHEIIMSLVGRHYHQSLLSLLIYIV